MAEDKKMKVVNITANSKAEALAQIREQFKDAPDRIKEHAYEASKEIERFFEGRDSKSKRTVLKTVRMTPAEMTRKKEVDEIIARARDLKNAADAAKQRLWAEIRLRLPDGFTTDADSMGLNDKTGEIEYYSED